MKDPADPSKPFLTRRTALVAAVGVGATVAVSGVTYVASAREPGGGGAVAEPLVIRVRDLERGRLEIFTGAGERIEVDDPKLATQLVRAASKGRGRA